MLNFKKIQYMSNSEQSYKLILEQLRIISGKDNFYFKPIKPKLSDIEIISLIIWAEFKSIKLKVGQ